MKNVFFLFTVLTSLSAFANVALDLDFKDYSKQEVTHFQNEIKANFDETIIYPLSSSKQEIEITVSEQMPEELKKMEPISNAVVINLKLYDIIKSERKLVNSSMIVTKRGQTASMEKFKD